MRQVVAPADVDDAADRGVAAGDGEEAGGGVLDVGQVAAGVEAPEPDRRPGQGLADDRRDDRAGRLAGAEGVERPEDRHGQAEGPVVALAQGVGADLGGRVGRLAPERVRLVDRDVPGRAVDLGGRGQDHPVQGRARPAGVQDVGGAEDVGLNHVERVLVRVRDRDQGAEVEDPGPRPSTALRTASGSFRSPRWTSTARLDLVGAGGRAARGRRGRCSGPGPGPRARRGRGSSTRWLPMNPPAPVTRTLLPIARAPSPRLARTRATSAAILRFSPAPTTRIRRPEPEPSPRSQASTRKESRRKPTFSPNH